MAAALAGARPARDQRRAQVRGYQQAAAELADHAAASGQQPGVSGLAQTAPAAGALPTGTGFAEQGRPAQAACEAQENEGGRAREDPAALRLKSCAPDEDRPGRIEHGLGPRAESRAQGRRILERPGDELGGGLQAEHKPGGSSQDAPNATHRRLEQLRDSLTLVLQTGDLRLQAVQLQFYCAPPDVGGQYAKMWRIVRHFYLPSSAVGPRFPSQVAEDSRACPRFAAMAAKAGVRASMMSEACRVARFAPSMRKSWRA